MTPEERHALAERMDEVREMWESTIGTRWAEPLSAAAAALREMPSTEEVVTAARASLWEQMESEAAERLTAEVARLREGIERHRQQVGHLGCDANPALWALLDTEGDADALDELRRTGKGSPPPGFVVAPADAVVIPRSAIPDGLIERLGRVARLIGGLASVMEPDAHWGLYTAVIDAARLLSGATTEGDEG